MSHAQIYSKILKESFILEKDGTIIFPETEVMYSKKEWTNLGGLTHNEIKAIHNAKTVFNEGRIIKINIKVN
jgi:hypothetical protein